MSNVPKSRREEHDFIATHNLRALRKAVTEIALYDFGYDKDRYEQRIQKFSEYLDKTDCKDKEAVIAKMRLKNETFFTDFVEEETRITRQIMRDAVAEFEMGNSIYPSGEALKAEYNERRLHLDRAIGYLYVLKQELQYIAETLPCDKNKYDGIIQEIKKEVSLIKGVRRATNKFLKKTSEK